MRRSLAPSVRRLSGRFKAARSDSADSTSEKKIRKCEIGSKENARDLVEMDRLTNEHDAFVRQLLSKPFKLPLRGDYNGETGIRSLGIRRSMGRRPLHDPMAENALVLYEPPPLTAEQNLRINKEDTLVHVVVDPILSNFLRPHQREGVKFMYECVTGLRVPNNFGCIMADEMGLGKTLQCISLLWTLLKQGPEAKPIVQKAVVVSPSSLVKNWADEIDKWLKGQLQALKIDGGCRGDVEKKLSQFVSSTNRQRGAELVLIISYETFRAHAEILCRSNECIGLLMCDEGHRLKNMENQTYCAINGLPCKRRVLLSGTPIQNDLLEYFSLVNFVNCGLLGSAGDFRKQFEIPILAARDANSTDTEQKTGQTKLNELTGIVNRCLIRRTQALLIKYLPTKYTFVVCCRLTEIQQKLYRSLIQKLMPSSVGNDDKNGLNENDNNSSVKRNKQAPPRKLCILLSFITILKNLCNHPQLISDKINDMDEEVEYLNACLSSSKHKGVLSFNPALSGKMIVLDRLLAVIRSTTNDNVVLISNYTQTLDLFERLCEMRNYRSVRLDGSMTIKGRGRIVNEFNNPASGIFAFILSSKAGGCGLNLIGANRLIMFDPDWNPANDEQAMARVWRDGQKKNCFVYRFVCTGTLEEKIIQRQAHKLALSNCVVDEADDVQRHFSKDELKDLFSLADRSVLDTNTSSSTHETFKCRRCVNGVQVTEPSFSENTSSSDLSTWSHCWTKKTISDSVLKKAWSDDLISFVFANRSHEQIKTA